MPPRVAGSCWGRGAFLLNRYRTTLETRISAGHELDSWPGCNLPHGHSYTIRVSIEGSPEPKFASSTIRPKPLEEFYSITGEYNRRSLNKMLAGAIPSVWGFANILYERLVMVMPGLVSVEVTQDDGISASVSNT